MSEQPIGTCSLCGGPVTVPSMMVNPVACCARCGARPVAPPYGPIIPMRPTPRATPPEFDVEVRRFWRGDGWRPTS